MEEDEKYVRRKVGLEKTIQKVKVRRKILAKMLLRISDKEWFVDRNFKK